MPKLYALTHQIYVSTRWSHKSVVGCMLTVGISSMPKYMKTPPRCRCQQPFDTFGDHRAACPRSGTLRSRGAALESAVARICREAGATVSTNVLLRDLNTDTKRTDDKRIEVIANGLPLWNGSQLAVDTTLVSPLTSAAQPRRDQRTTLGAALRIARKAKERTYPQLVRQGLWHLRSVDGGAQKRQPSSAY